MTHYSWTIHAAQDTAAGDLGPMYLSLHGLRATTSEIELYAKKDGPISVASGVVAVERDLGELQTGSLRTQEFAATWLAIDWVRVVNLSDGRQWTARGGVCDGEGSCPILRFRRTRDAFAIRMTPPDADAETYESTLDRGDTPMEDAPQSARAVVHTYEIFGMHRGRVVPLTQILRMASGVKKLLPDSRILITDQASQGFGLAGEPGSWEDLYPGGSPEMYGLDSDRPVLASDGVRGWVLDAHYLAMLFGAGWRRVVYGN